MLRLELEFEKLSVIEMQEVLDVQMLQYEEQTIMKPYMDARDKHYTTAHLKAGRKILQAIRNFKDIKRPII